MFSRTGLVPKIQDYGVVGDCRAAALVSKYGSVDWLCWPRFDSPSIFAALLDSENGGHWSITPTQPFEAEHHYIRDSNVLVTQFDGPEGRATLTDLMPVSSEGFKRGAILPDHELVRELLCTDGEIKIEIEFRPRAYYGLKPVQIRDLGELGLRMDVGRGAYLLRSTVPLKSNSDRANASLCVKRGEIVSFLSATRKNLRPSYLRWENGRAQRLRAP